MIAEKIIQEFSLLRKNKVFIRKFFLHWLRKFSSAIRTLPDFIIIGAQRCGTTSLYNYLIQHPSILLSFKKEVHFFNDNFNKGINWYRSFFPSVAYKNYKKYLYKRNFITGEATPDYIFHPYAAKRTFSVLPKIKIIVLLRNPVNRAYSHYYMNVRNGFEKLSFEEAIKRAQEIFDKEVEKMLDEKYTGLFYPKYSYLGRGIYIDQIKNWLKFFPKKQVLIIKSEDLFNNSQETLKRIFKFLNVPNWELDKFIKYQYAGNPRMDENTREWLINYYKPHNQRLYKYLGINFNWEE